MTITQLYDGRVSYEIRQSNLSSFQMCPEKARADWLDQTPSTHTDSTALGTAFHAACEFALHEQRDGAQLANIDDLIDVACNELDTIGDWTYTKMSKANVYVTALRLCEAWHEDIYGTYEPVGIEASFRHLLYSDERRDIYLKGTRDCVTADGLVIDHKSASSLRSWDAWEKQRWAPQPTVYTWATWLETSPRTPTMPVRPFRYDVVGYDGETRQVEVWRDQSHIDWICAQALQLVAMVEADLKVWPLNDAGWWCHDKWCSRWSECKGKFMRTDWTATKI